MSTWTWYSSWDTSSAVRSLLSCSAAIHVSAASSTTFLPTSCTPARTAATVLDCGSPAPTLADSSAHSSSKLFTDGKRTASWRRSDVALGQPSGCGQCCLHCLGSLVLTRAGKSGPGHGLRVVVAGEYTEPDRHAGVDADANQSVRRGLAHIVEVRGLPPDHDAECDDGVVAGPGESGCGHRELETARHAKHAGVVDSEVGQCAVGSVHQPVHDGLVPKCCDHGNAQPFQAGWSLARVRCPVPTHSKVSSLGVCLTMSPSRSSPSSTCPMRSRFVRR